MRLHEYWSKWRTSRTERKIVSITNAIEPHNKIEVTIVKHSAPFGEFLAEYVKHINIPWWKRNRGWRIVEEKFRQKFNEMGNVEWDQ